MTNRNYLQILQNSRFFIISLNHPRIMNVILFSKMIWYNSNNTLEFNFFNQFHKSFFYNLRIQHHFITHAIKVMRILFGFSSSVVSILPPKQIRILMYSVKNHSQLPSNLTKRHPHHRIEPSMNIVFHQIHTCNLISFQQHHYLLESSTNFEIHQILTHNLMWL